jgi:hypothetical protein
MSNSLSTAAGRPARPRFLLQDAEGIDGLIAHLITHRKLPRIEVGNDAFPPAEAHRARARIARYSAMSGVQAGGLLAGLAVLLSTGLLIPSTYRDWNYLQGWSFAQNWTKAAWLIVPALCVGLIAFLAVEVWIRMKLLQELRRLRKRSAGWSAGTEALQPPVVEASLDQQPGNTVRDPITILSRLSEQHIVQLHALYQHEWWSKGRSLDATRRGVKGSQVVIGLANGSNELVAFARVLTDYTFKAVIFDVIVAETSRRQQLGRKLLELVTNHEALRDVRHFELYCLPELVEFYVPHGFSTDVGNIRLMRKVRPDE